MNFSEAPTLVGSRVVLEQLSTAHAPELALAVAERELWKTWYTSIPSPDEMESEIAHRLKLHSEGLMAPWVVRRVSDGRGVGMTAYVGLDSVNRRLEIGHTWISASSQGTGINREAKLLLLTRAFEDLGCIAVEFRTHWHNRQSRAAIAALGAKQDGVLRNHRFGPDGTLRDTVVFSIIDSEWPTVRMGLKAGLAAARG